MGAKRLQSTSNFPLKASLNVEIEVISLIVGKKLKKCGRIFELGGV